jgi:RAP1 GTPase activating protein 1
LTAHAHPALSEASDDSSLTSEDLEEHLAGGYIDSDTGLESMSSAETAAKACSVCQDRPTSTTGPSAEVLAQEVAKLKCDKLDLLRQNVVSVGCDDRGGRPDCPPVFACRAVKGTSSGCEKRS